MERRKKTDAQTKADVYEISLENVKASKTDIRSFEQATRLLDETVKLISENAADISDVHGGFISGALVKIVTS